MMDHLTVVVAPEPLAIRTDLDAWALSIKKHVGGAILHNIDSSTDHLDRYIACVEVAEVPGLFMACAFYQRDINEALTRAGLFMGAGKGLVRGTLAPAEDYALINYKKLVAGHNLPGSVVADFLNAADTARGVNLRLNDFERVFFNTFLNSASVGARLDRYYLIGLSVQSTKDFRSVVSHEIYHAHYYLNPSYRTIVREFWTNDVSVDDRARITGEIGRAYNVEDEDLVIDEFQAYLLQSRAEHDLAKSFVPQYRDPLRDRLSRLGIDLGMV